MVGFLIVAGTSLLIYVCVHMPAIRDLRLWLNLLRRKLLFAFILGVFTSVEFSTGKTSTTNGLSIVFVVYYAFWTLSKDCPKGYAESAVPLLKFLFVLASFFTSFGFQREELLPTILTVCILGAICVATCYAYRKAQFDNKSNYIEIACLCVEHFAALIATYMLASNNIAKVFVMVVSEEIILTTVHIFLMYFIKRIYHEDTFNYFAEKRLEILE